MIPKGILDAFLAEVSARGQSASAWGVAWARVLPTVLLVPAFGLGLLPLGLRLAIGFVLAVSVAPLLHPTVASASVGWPALVLSEVARGLPVALTASISLWAATVAGGIADHVTGARRVRGGGKLGLADGAPFSTLLFLAAAVSFLQLGGAERIAARLAAPDLTAAGPLTLAVRDLAAGIDLGVGIGAPLLVVAMILDMTILIAAREHSTVGAGTTLAPLRSLALLVATAAMLDRMADMVAARGAATP